MFDAGMSAADFAQVEYAGPDAPAPAMTRQLTGVDEMAVQLRSRENDTALFRRLFKAVAGVRHRVFAGHFPMKDQDDINQAASIALITAVRTYDPARAGFFTHYNFKLQDERKRLRIASHPLGGLAGRLKAPVNIESVDTITGANIDFSMSPTAGAKKGPGLEGECLRETSADETIDCMLKRRFFASFLTDYELAPRRHPLLGRRDRLIAEAYLFHEKLPADACVAARINRERVRQVIQDVLQQFAVWCRAYHPELAAAAAALPGVLGISQIAREAKSEKKAPPRSGQVIAPADSWAAIEQELGRLSLVIPVVGQRRSAPPLSRMARMHARRAPKRDIGMAIIAYGR